MIPHTLISAVSVIVLCEILIPQLPVVGSHEASALSLSLSLPWAMDSAEYSKASVYNLQLDTPFLL